MNEPNDGDMDDEMNFDEYMGTDDDSTSDLFGLDDEDFTNLTSPMSDSIDNAINGLLEVADIEAVFGTPIRQRDTVIIPAAEVGAVLGFGMGMGSGPVMTDGEQKQYLTGSQTGSGNGSGAGGGGGGSSFARPVAVIVSGPDGVRVEPIFDLTKIALAGLTAGVFVLGMLAQLGKLRGRIDRIGKELS